MEQEKLLNGRYRLVQQHGSGGMAVIYKATDLALGRTVAVKILRPSLTNDQSFLVRFRQEARNVANLTHPNIVTVHDVGQDGNTHYIVMEFLDGQDLKKLIRANSPLPMERALSIAIQICAGVGYAHRAGLVHADVKPQNILILDSDKVKVTDFGIAQALAATNPPERQKIVWGSPHYFSPEQAQGEYPTPASDVYSIGVVIFEMLTGRLPFIGADQQALALSHIRDTPPRISELNAQVPTSLDHIIHKVLAKEPSARYRTADQLGRILIAYKEQGREETSGMSPIQVANPVVNEPVVQPPTVQAPYPKAPASYAPPPGGAYTTMPSPYQQGFSEVPTEVGWSGPTPDSGYYQSIPAPDIMRNPGYRSPQPQSLDVVTILLAFVALIAMTGVVILWIFVWEAYFG
jgi:eukaryotic-like serine/threonine-protein kinase